MRFVDIFSAQHDCLVIGFLIVTDILNFHLICAPCCLKRVPVIFTDFEHPFSNDHMPYLRPGLNLFQKFQSLELIVWSALALEKGQVIRNSGS